VHIRQETSFPERAGTRLHVRAARPSRFTLRLRHPAWCRVMTVSVNGRRVLESRDGSSWLDVQRRWRDGDIVDVQLPMHLHLAPLPGAQADIGALMYGPMVLAARMGSAGMSPGDDLIVNERTYGDVLALPTPMPMPRLALHEGALEDAVRPANGSLAFRVQAQDPASTFELVPYHRIAHERYNLYWRLA
jgi:DUF1680 family protein